MSHWKKFETDTLSDVRKDLLVKALEEMGLGMNEEINHIFNTWGNEKVDAALTKDGQPLSLGFNFKKEGGKTKLELTGDFFGTGLNEAAFLNQLAQYYQKHNALEQLELQGWYVENTGVNKNGDIVIEAYQYA